MWSEQGPRERGVGSRERPRGWLWGHWGGGLGRFAGPCSWGQSGACPGEVGWRGGGASLALLLEDPPAATPLGTAFGQAGRQWVAGPGAGAASPFVPRPWLPPTPFPGLRRSEARVPLPGRGGPGRPGGVPSAPQRSRLPAVTAARRVWDRPPALGSNACARPPPPACASCFL